MADSPDSAAPEWLFIMRHAQAAWPPERTAAPYGRTWRSVAPAEVLTPRGATEAGFVGGTFPNLLDAHRGAVCPVQVTRFLAESPEAAFAPAMTFRSAYEQTAYEIQSKYGVGPPPLATLDI